MDKLDGKTFDVVKDNIEKMKELFPEVFTEEKISMDKLMLTLGEHVEKEKERYEFTWNGKAEAIQTAQKQTTGTLRPCEEESVHWDTSQNLYLEGDNLEVLRILQNSYRNKVKMIYIDPPYNTGKDFIYSDNFHDNVKSYKERIDDNYKTNVETNGRFHTDWLNMMYPRLKVAKNLLAEDGVIFISIDDNEVFNLKKICDEIFDENNFIDMFSWKKTGTPANLSTMTKKSLEYILLYKKSKSPNLKGLTKVSKSTNGLMNQTNAEKTLIFPKEETETSLKNGIYEKGMYGTDAYHIELMEDTAVKDGVFTEDVILHGRFKWSQDYLRKQMEEGVKIYIKSKAFSPSYEKEEYDPEKPWNIIDSTFGVGTNENASTEVDTLMGSNFSDGLYPKPVSLLKYLIHMATEKNDIVLDFFSGSSTTAHAVMALNMENEGNRRFIMVQLPEEIDGDSQAAEAGYGLMTDIGKERIRRAAAELSSEKNSFRHRDADFGFKVFKLDETNLQIWDEASENVEEDLLTMVDPVKEDRTQEDVVYEILLKYGVDLSIPIEKKKIAAKDVYDVGNRELLICLETELTLDVIEALAALAPARVVFYDEGFKDDTARINAEQILKRHGVTDISVI